MHISKCTSILVVQGKHLKHTLQWVMITTSASGVFTPVDGRKTTTVQVAEGQDHLRYK